MSETRAISTTSRRELSSSFFCKGMRRRKFTPFRQKHELVYFLVGLRTYQHPCKNNWARHYHKGTQAYIHGTRSSCHILMKLEFSRQIFHKNSNIKFNKNPSSRSLNVPCGRRDVQTDGRMDRHDESHSHFSKFWEHAQEPEVLLVFVMKAYTGSRGIAPYILNICTG